MSRLVELESVDDASSVSSTSPTPAPFSPFTLIASLLLMHLYIKPFQHLSDAPEDDEASTTSSPSVESSPSASSFATLAAPPAHAVVSHLQKMMSLSSLPRPPSPVGVKRRRRASTSAAREPRNDCAEVSGIYLRAKSASLNATSQTGRTVFLFISTRSIILYPVSYAFFEDTKLFVVGRFEHSHGYATAYRPQLTRSRSKKNT